MHKLFELIRYWSPEDSGGGGDSPGEQTTNTDSDGSEREDEGGAPGAQTWEAFLATLSDEEKTLYESHTSGLRSALQKERSTNKISTKDRKRLEELEQLQKDREDAEKTEVERLTSQVTELRTQLDEALASGSEQRLHLLIINEAMKLSFQDPEDAYSMVDLSEVEIAEDEIKGLSAALKDLAKKKPYLLKTNEKKPPDIDAQTGHQKKQSEVDKQAIRTRFRIGQ